jgi:hypothetical protein
VHLLLRLQFPIFVSQKQREKSTRTVPTTVSGGDLGEDGRGSLMSGSPAVGSTLNEQKRFPTYTRSRTTIFGVDCPSFRSPAKGNGTKKPGQAQKERKNKYLIRTNFPPASVSWCGESPQGPLPLFRVGGAGICAGKNDTGQPQSIRISQAASLCRTNRNNKVRRGGKRSTFLFLPVG